ncbi:MAG: class I SAM-dependent methyltransferase [Flavobacteriales bacterium]
MSKRELLVRNDLGFFEVKEKPDTIELEEYYSKKYYQSSQGNYRSGYSDEELNYFEAKNEQRFLLAETFAKKKNNSFLDVGCGEGFLLDHYRKKGWNVLGLDYSSFGCEKMCPESLPFLRVGDIYKNLDELLQSGNTFDVISLTNVLEHVVDPAYMLSVIHKIAHDGSVLVITVPNDFSFYQEFLLEEKLIPDEFWIALPDHLSYFDKDSLSALCFSTGWNKADMIADFPIDLFLANQHSNYVIDRSKGKEAHKVRVKLENLFHSISPEKTNSFYRSMAELGFGRQITGFFTVKAVAK